MIKAEWGVQLDTGQVLACRDKLSAQLLTLRCQLAGMKCETITWEEPVVPDIPEEANPE